MSALSECFEKSSKQILYKYFFHIQPDKSDKKQTIKNIGDII